MNICNSYRQMTVVLLILPTKKVVNRCRINRNYVVIYQRRRNSSDPASSLYQNITDPIIGISWVPTVGNHRKSKDVMEFRLSGDLSDPTFGSRRIVQGTDRILRGTFALGLLYHYPL